MEDRLCERAVSDRVMCACVCVKNTCLFSSVCENVVCHRVVCVCDKVVGKGVVCVCESAVGARAVWEKVVSESAVCDKVVFDNVVSERKCVCVCVCVHVCFKGLCVKALCVCVQELFVTMLCV